MSLRTARSVVKKLTAAAVVDAANMKISTSDLHGASHLRFTKKYATQRAQMDYRFHSNYSLERQALQDKIVDTLVPRRMEATGGLHPWLVFSAGAMGSGKTTTLQWMQGQNFFPLPAFAFIDHDAVREMLPEMQTYRHILPEIAGQLTQQETGFIVELATRRCIDMRVHCLVDGSLRDSKWYRHHINEFRAAVPHQRIGIIHVTAHEDDIRARAAKRARITGRRVPDATLRASIEQVPVSVAALQDCVDVVVTINNSGELQPRFDSLLYPKASRLPTRGLQLVSPPWQLLWANFTEDFRKDADDTPPPTKFQALPEDAFRYRSSITECHAHRGCTPDETVDVHRRHMPTSMDLAFDTSSALPEDKFTWCGSTTRNGECYAQAVSMAAI